MRKIIVVVLSIICIALIVLIIVRETSREKVEIKVFFVEGLQEEHVETIQFCAIDKYDNFNMIKVEIPEYIDDLYTFVFDLYNNKRNALPLDYSVVSKELLYLNQIHLENDIVYIDIKKTSVDINELNRIVSALKITYQYLGIKDVVMTIDKAHI